MEEQIRLLNEAYRQLEEMYNAMISNWDWFANGQHK